MKKLSKHQRKRMTPEEIDEYESAMKANEPEVIKTWGGKIIISKGNWCFQVECFDHEGDKLDDAHFDTRDECNGYIEDCIDLLVEYDPEDED
jgi:hypothetical protein